MNTTALIMLLLTQGLVTVTMVYFLMRVLKTPLKNDK